MSQQHLPDEQKLSQLKTQIKGSLADTWRKYKLYDRLDIILILLSIILSAGITILGFLGHGTTAGIIGVILTALLSTQKVFNFSDKADFYRRTHMQTKELRDRLTYKVSSESGMQAVVDDFITLRNDRIYTNPRRKEWEETEKAIQDLH